MSAKSLVDYVQENNLTKVRELIASGADINQPSGFYNETPLYIASKWGYLDIVKVLIAAGADTNKGIMYGSTPLQVAAEKRHLEIVKVLLEAGADVNKADVTRMTPLFFAVAKGALEIVKVLLKAGADFSSKAGFQHISPLYMASEAGRLEIVKELLKAGADISSPNYNGKSLLTLAKEKKFRTDINKHIIDSLGAATYEKRKNALKFYTYLPKERENEIIAANLARMNAAEEARAGAGGPTIEPVDGGRRKRRATRRKARKTTRRSRR